MIGFLKNITKLLDKANTIKALRHAHITYYINYDVVSTVEQKDAPVCSNKGPTIICHLTRCKLLT